MELQRERRRRGVAVEVLTDVMVVAGFASVSYGAWLAYPPAGFIVAGALSMAIGLVAAVRR